MHCYSLIENSDCIDAIGILLNELVTTFFVENTRIVFVSVSRQTIIFFHIYIDSIYIFVQKLLIEFPICQNRSSSKLSYLLLRSLFLSHFLVTFLTHPKIVRYCLIEDVINSVRSIANSLRLCFLHVSLYMILAFISKQNSAFFSFKSDIVYLSILYLQRKYISSLIILDYFVLNYIKKNCEFDEIILQYFVQLF